MSEKQKIQLVIPANLNYSALIRHIADEVFAIAKFSKAWCSRLKLIVDELFMNAVRYGSTQDKSLIYITFLYDEDGIQFTIEDDGTGTQAISPEDLKAIIQKNEKNTDVTKTSGRGLSMITKLWTDQIEITQSQYGGVAVSFNKRIETATTPPPLPVPFEEKKSAPAVQTTKGLVHEIRLSGEIDQTNIDAKTAPIYDQIEVMPENGVLVLDFSDVKYINSTFIGNLTAWHATMQHKGGHVRLKNMNDQIKEILGLVGLLSVLEVET